VQRKIRRSEREGLACEEGTSESQLAKFYHLLRLTRRRHGVPPQPLAWFRNLIDCLGEKVTIHIASKDGQPISSILTLSFKKTIVYKYGCSDAQYHNLGGMPFLFWRAIQEAKKMALEEFDFGRSDLEDSGLVTFKDHLGASRSTLTYYRYPASQAGLAANGWKLQTAKWLFAHLPDPALTLAGRLLYKHIG
jgi:lipid II:glycine glycyltransferase (peptidoglycan interpeptide bridge formation enzyme)